MYADKIYTNNITQDRINYPKYETKMYQRRNDYFYDKTHSESPTIIDIREEKVINFGTVDNVEEKLTFLPNYISEKEAKDLYDNLVENINWKQREGVNKNGETYLEPRKTCWFGKPYKYSAVTWDENEEWNDQVEKLRNRLNEDHPISEDSWHQDKNFYSNSSHEKKDYNSVMCNYYRDKNDSIGWHADDETSLGRFPKIASISLGCERVFEVCKRNEYYNRYNSSNSYNSVFNGCSILYRFHLNPGSLLLMEGAIQEKWLHRVPREKNDMDGRINLTYRYIVSEEEERAEIERRKELKRKRIPNNKDQHEDRKQSVNYSDEPNGFHKDRKLSSNTDKDESSREYSKNRNRSNNYNNYNKPAYRKRYEGENNRNNYWNDNNYYRKSPRYQEEWKSENKESFNEEVAKNDYYQKYLKRGISKG